MTIIATQIRHAASQSIKSHTAPSHRLGENGYTAEEFRQFKKNMVTAATIVPTSLGGGENGHAWLLMEGGILQFHRHDVHQ